MKSKKPTTNPYGMPRLERTIHVASVARTLTMMLPSV